jgi:hypothetical protein
MISVWGCVLKQFEIDHCWDEDPLEKVQEKSRDEATAKGNNKSATQ